MDLEEVLMMGLFNELCWIIDRGDWLINKSKRGERVKEDIDIL